MGAGALFSIETESQPRSKVFFYKLALYYIEMEPGPGSRAFL